MLQLQFRSLDPGKHLRSPVVELPSYVISYFATGEVLGMGILEEFLEFNTKSEQENIRGFIPKCYHVPSAAANRESE